ncbi:MAG TPA: lamin tail domain-containing protein, partial [Deltaproteobacteria bacterium]|nr:lamin tail domain-containing protein [Deltaproteobacteria bacterium]
GETGATGLPTGETGATGLPTGATGLPTGDTGATGLPTGDTGATGLPTGGTGLPTGGTGLPPLPLLVINEALADPPPGLLGDANCDGVAIPSQDTFVEIWNLMPAPVDLSGAGLSDATALRHTFPPGSVVQPGTAILVFGGGVPLLGGTGISGTWCSPISGTAQVASTGGLGLDPSADTVQLVAADGRTIDTFTWSSGSSGVSNNRLPEQSVAGIVVPHDAVAGSVNGFSPGTGVGGVPAAWSAVITIDADLSDVPVEAQLSSSTGTPVGIAWSSDTLFLAIQHPLVASAGADAWLVVHTGTGGGASTTSGIARGIQQPTLPFGASAALAWRTDDASDSLFVWDGAQWQETPGWLGTSGSAWAVDPGTATIELALPLAALGVTTTLDLYVAFVVDAPGAEATVGASPASAIVEGALDPDPGQRWRFYPRLADPPSLYLPLP